MRYKITFVLIFIFILSYCFAQNDVQQSISSLIGRMNQMELKSAEDTTAIQILTEAMDRLQGIVFLTIRKKFRQ
jgi:hypothetical protein